MKKSKKKSTSGRIYIFTEKSHKSECTQAKSILTEIIPEISISEIKIDYKVRI
jgi:hypothetical protein